jgi:hypothetical protein
MWAKKNKDIGEVAQDKLDDFSTYDPTTPPVLTSHPTKGNKVNHKLMLAKLESFMKEELALLVNKANMEFFKMTNCLRCTQAHSKCIYSVLTAMFVELQIKIRYPYPMKVTPLMVDKSAEAFEEVYNAYQRQWIETGDACHRIVGNKLDVKTI